jgi:hypothetical protein
LTLRKKRARSQRGRRATRLKAVARFMPLPIYFHGCGMLCLAKVGYFQPQLWQTLDLWPKITYTLARNNHKKDFQHDNWS